MNERRFIAVTLLVAFAWAAPVSSAAQGQAPAAVAGPESPEPPASSSSDPAPPTSQDATAIDGTSAIERALAAHPGYRATAIEVRRAREHVRAEVARYQLVLHLEGSFNAGNTAAIQFDRSVAFPYGENLALAAELQAPLDTGTLLAVRATGSRSFRRQVFSFQAGMAPITAEIGPGYGLDLTLTVTQPFLRGFGTGVGRAELRNAEVALAGAEATRARRATELVRDTLQAYAELWYAEQAVTIDHAAHELAVRQRDDATARIEVGVLSRADTLALATRVASLEEVIAVAEADRRSRAILLATLLGMPLGSEVHATAAPPPLPFQPTDAEAVALATADSPLLAELRTQADAARRGAELASEPLRPRLDAQAQVGLHGVGYDDVPEAFGQVGRFAAFTAMVGLVYETPLDDTRLHAEEERARLSVDVAEQRYEEARMTIEQQVMTLLLQRAAARRRIELATQTVELARETVEAERSRLELGTRTPTALLTAQEDLRAAELRVSRARVDLYATETALLSFVGRLLDEVDLPN
jgi:outer membrane protein TolC